MKHRLIKITVIFCLSTAVCGQSEFYSKYEAMVEVSNASALLLDPLSESLYVGARDSILVLHPSTLKQKHPAIVWKVPEQERKSCVPKVKLEEECGNYICMLELLNDGSIYVCGSYAYNPQCAYIDPLTFRLKELEGGGVKMEEKKGICPYGPRHTHTSVLADGILYSASYTNFLGTTFDVARVTGPDKEQVHIQPTWLSAPEFVSSAVVGGAEPSRKGYIYWFLMERVLENDLDLSVRSVKVAKVARVCKADLGGSKTLQQRWTTFLKAGLVCRETSGGRYYDLLTHLQPLEHRPGDPASTHFYGLFTSQGEGELVSAVCVFSVAEVDQVMATSAFKDTKTCGNSASSTPVPSPRPGQCIDSSQGYNSSLRTPDQVLTFAREHPQILQPVVAAPLLVRRGITYTRLAAANFTDTSSVILHLGTDQGELHSVSVVGGVATLLQEISVTTSVEPVENILVVQGGVLVGGASSLRVVQVERCGRYSSCEVCVGARGLGCTWDSNNTVCTKLPPGSSVSDVDVGRLEVCGAEAGLCSPQLQELRVTEGVRLLLPCSSLSLSPSPACTWSHPPARHIRLHPCSHLEVLASNSSQGLYSCHCPARGASSLGSPACLTASYQLVLEAGLEGCSERLHGDTAAVGVYLVCVLLGALLGALVTAVVVRRLGRSTPLGASGNPTLHAGSPTCYANEGVMSDTSRHQSGAGVL